MHGLLRCNINAGVSARVRSGHVTQRCHNSSDRKPGYRVRVTSRTGSSRRIWGVLKTGHRTRRVDLRGSQRPDELAHYGRRTKWGYAEMEKPETFNSKVIKGFVPELRSRVFRVSRFLCSMYICYEHSMYVSHIHVWLWYMYGYGTFVEIFFLPSK